MLSCGGAFASTLARSGGSLASASLGRRLCAWHLQVPAPLAVQLHCTSHRACASASNSRGAADAASASAGSDGDGQEGGEGEGQGQGQESSAHSSESKSQGKPRARRAAVDTTTPLDEHRSLRHVEKRIEQHLKDHGTSQVEEGQHGLLDSPKVGEPSGALAPQEQGQSSPATPSSPSALRINDPSAPDAAGGKEVIVRSRTTTGQVLWPATQEDIEILSQSKLLYPAPYEVEGSVIIRLVRLSDPVTSPVARVVSNRQFGIRGNEKWQLLAMGVVFCGLIYSLGVWQLYRMEWKQKLIELRRTRLAMPRLQVTGSPFPWRDNIGEYVYRVVEVRGVFDHRREMHVGPRPGSDNMSGETLPGYVVVTPLRLEDGSTILVNRGHLPMDRLDQATRPEIPKWVRVKGVLEEGEIPNLVGRYARLKNRPDKNQFVYLVAEDLAENSGARNHQECMQALVTALDVMYEDDFQAGVRRELPFSMRHKDDYLLFWADEHTHFNYAMQWFGMGTLILVMTVYKFIEVSRWRF